MSAVQDSLLKSYVTALNTIQGLETRVDELIKYLMQLKDGIISIDDIKVGDDGIKIMPKPPKAAKKKKETDKEED